MIRHLKIILLVFFTPCITIAQNTAPQKKDNIILVKNDYSISENFKMSGKAMIEAGFLVGSKDNEFGLLKSEEVAVKDPWGENYAQIIEIVVKDSVVRITSKAKRVKKIKTFGFEKENLPFKEVIYKGDELGSHGLFGNMESIAKLIEGEIYYTK